MSIRQLNGFLVILNDIDSATNTIMGKSTDLSIDLKVHIIDLVNCKTKKKCKVHGTDVSGRKQNTLTSGQVRIFKTKPENTKKQVCSELEAAGRQVSTVKWVLHQHEPRGFHARKKPLIRMWRLEARLKFAALPKS